MDAKRAKALIGWCKGCAGVRELDREMGCCATCGCPHVSSRRPVEAPVLEAA